MTKVEQARVVAWRLKILRYSRGEPRQVSRTCRHFGVSRTMFYRWKRRFEAHGEAAWPTARGRPCDRHGRPHPR